MLPASPAHAFADVADRRPDLPFLIAPAAAALPYAPEGFRITYGEACARIGDLRAGYARAGYGIGSRVALVLGGRPEFFFHWLALNGIGTSIVPINPDLRPDELRHQMDIARPDLIVHLPEHANLVREGAPDTASTLPGQPIPAAARPRDAASDGAGGADTECALLFTSGSTGKPKGCVLSNFYFMNLAEWYVTLGGVVRMQPDCEIALTPLPFFHMNALGCTAVGMMVVGGAVVPIDRFSASRWWASVADSRATIVHNLGVIPAILLQLPEDEAEHRHCARFNFSPGVDARHKTDFEARFGLPIVEGWAMTETGGSAVTCTAGQDYPPGLRCVGKPRDGMEYRLVDDDGRDVAPGRPGELLVRAAGPDPRRGFFSGYLGDPQATEAAWAEGWFHTGDVLSADAAGLLYFVDRKKSIIRRSGENISALEVESVLKDCSGVVAVAVTPVPDPVRGEEVFAFIRIDTGADACPPETRAAQLIDAAARRLSYHKLPGYVAFVDRIPVGSTQKLLRGQLRADAATALGTGQSIDLRDRKTALRTAAAASSPGQTSGTAETGGVT